MNSEKENFYNILGVQDSSTGEDIKKAYRKMSLKYHPDKNNGDPESVKMFQKISEAYEVLGDAQKRNEYDMMRKNPFMRMGQPGGGGMHFDQMDDFLSNIIFGGLGGMPFGPGGMPFGPGGMPFPPGGPNIRIFRNGVPVNFGNEKPQAITKNISINMETVLNGGKIPIEIERWILENGNQVHEKQTLYVDIVKGIDNNEIIVLKDQGNVVNENCKGDVKIFIKIENDSEFQRRGLDLILEKRISLKEALCGFSFDLKYINGKIYTINNHAGNVIPPEYQKVIPNMGLTRDNHVGNLIIIFHVEFPEKMTLENIEILKTLL
jgi:DnaJ-class molecular chaperone|uniref:J domain-containing protein n=1 Tax=viral metagenome TaxID=1070528 RepID=A0A6C0DEH7_9ZZZZ